MFKIEKIEQYTAPFIKMILILVIGYMVVRVITGIVKRALEKSRLDRSFTDFACKAFRIVMYVILIMSALSTIGVSTTGMLAALSASAVAVAVGLKDSLGNVAGGILLLLSPRFSYGDYIKVDDDEGNVVHVDLLHTTVVTADNKQISIPNGVLINSNIINYSKSESRRVDLNFPIPYEADIEKVKEIVNKTLRSHELVLKEKEAPVARVIGYADSSVTLVTRCWCKTENYWNVYFDLNEQVRSALEAKNIVMPYNKLEVTLNEGKDN